MFLRFSLRLPAALVSEGLWACTGCCAEVTGAGDEVPDVALMSEAEAFPPVMPETGVPNRSTPSLAAEMMADPSIEGSKREGMDPALLRPRPCETDPVEVAVGA